eukprot:s3051_g11.t1
MCVCVCVGLCLHTGLLLFASCLMMKSQECAALVQLQIMQKEGEKVNNEVARYTQQIEQWKQKSQQLRRQKTDDLTRRNQQHEVAVQTLQHRLDQLQKEIIQCNRCAKSWEEEKSKKSHGEKGPTSTAALPGLVIFQRPLPSNHEKRKALLIGVNYVNSHAPLKGCVNDIWNLQCLLRHTLRYSPEQLQILADGFDGRPRPDRIPTKANIMATG